MSKVINCESVGSSPGIYDLYLSEDALVFALDFDAESDVLDLFVLESTTTQRDATQINVITEQAYTTQRVDYFVGWFKHPTFGRLFVFVLR